MTNANRLTQLTAGITDALDKQDLPLANQLADERLLFLQCLCAADEFDSELINAAISVLAHDTQLSIGIESEKSNIQQRLRNVITADKATQLYRENCK